MARTIRSRLSRAGGSLSWSRAQASRSSGVVIPANAAIPGSGLLTSALCGDPVLRHPGIIADANNLPSLVAQSGQRRAHAVALPIRRRHQIIDCGARGPLQQDQDATLLGLLRR